MGLPNVYKDYFQKSTVFLFPLLGISKQVNFKPTDRKTYISITDMIKPDACMLIVPYDKVDNIYYERFRKSVLLSHELLSEIIVTDTQDVCIFSLRHKKNDFYHFIAGKYSLMSDDAKDAARKYQGASSKEWAFMESYFYPEQYFEEYADLLGMKEEVLRISGELCDSPDLDKETFILDNLEVSK